MKLFWKGYNTINQKIIKSSSKNKLSGVTDLAKNKFNQENILNHFLKSDIKKRAIKLPFSNYVAFVGIVNLKDKDINKINKDICLDVKSTSKEDSDSFNKSKKQLTHKNRKHRKHRSKSVLRSKHKSAETPIKHLKDKKCNSGYIEKKVRFNLLDKQSRDEVIEKSQKKKHNERRISNAACANRIKQGGPYQIHH